MITDETIFSGADGSWIDSFADYPASEYDLVVLLKNGTNAAVELTAAPDEDDPDSFSISYTADQLQAGDCEYQYKFTNKATEKISVPYHGVVNVLALLSSSTDTRSEDKKVYDELIAARLRLAEREYVEVSVNGKSTKFKSMDQIEKEINRYKRKLGLLTTPQIINSF